MTEVNPIAESTSWLETIDPHGGYRHIFGGQAPHLAALRLKSLQLSAGGVALLLTHAGLPSGSPAAWADRGHDAIALVVRCAGTMRQCAGCVQHQAVEMSAEQGTLGINAHDASFSASIAFYSAAVEIRPYTDNDVMAPGISFS